MGPSVSSVIANNSAPLTFHKRFVLNDKRRDFASVLFEPNPDAIPAGDHLDIGFLDHRFAIVYDKPNKSRKAASLPIPHQNKRRPEVGVRKGNGAGSREHGAWSFTELADAADAAARE